jgi:hypothetical protein
MIRLSTGNLVGYMAAFTVISISISSIEARTSILLLPVVSTRFVGSTFGMASSSSKMVLHTVPSGEQVNFGAVVARLIPTRDERRRLGEHEVQESAQAVVAAELAASIVARARRA